MRTPFRRRGAVLLKTLAASPCLMAYSNAFAGGYAGGKTNIIGVGLIKSF